MRETEKLANAFKPGVEKYYEVHKSCPVNGAYGGSGFAADTALSGAYASKVDFLGRAPGCLIQATMRSSGIPGGIEGTTLTLQMADSGGIRSWSCMMTASQEYGPKDCLGTWSKQPS